MKNLLIFLTSCGMAFRPDVLLAAINDFRWNPGASGFLWHSPANWIGATGYPDDRMDRARFDIPPANNHPVLNRDVAGNVGGGLGQLILETAGWWVSNEAGTTNTICFDSLTYFSGQAVVSRGTRVNTLDVWLRFLNSPQAILTDSGSTLVIARGLHGGFAPIIDSLSPTSADTGAVRLDAPSSGVSGSFYLRQGTLLIRHSGALTGSSLDIGGDALVIDGAQARLLTDAAGVVITQNVTVRAYAAHQVYATLGGNQTSGASSFNGIVTLQRDTRLTSANTDGNAVSFNNLITGPAGIIKTGPGTVALNAVNTYAGPTIVQRGILQLGTVGALPASTTVTVSNEPSAVLYLNHYPQTIDSLWGGGAAGGLVLLGTATLTVGSGDFSGVIAGAGGLTKTGPGVLTLGGTNTYTGLTTVGGGTLRFAAPHGIPNSVGVWLANAPDTFLDLNSHDQLLNGLSGGSLTGGQILLGSATLSVGLGSFSGVISGSGGLTKVGPGMLTLSGRNLYTGTTTVAEGLLRMGATNALPPGGPVVIADAAGTTLDLNNYPQEIGSLTGGGSAGGMISLGTATLTVAAGDFAGVIAGSGGLNKTGTGTLILRGANTYSGVTHIEAGTLRLGQANALPTSTTVTLVPSPEAVLDLNGFDQTIASLLGGGVWGGAITLGTGTLTVGEGDFSGVISGLGGLTKVGASRLILRNRNTFTGETRILGGTLVYGTDEALSSSTLVVDGPDASLDLDSHDGTAELVLLANHAQIVGSATLKATSAFVFSSGTVNAQLTGPAGLMKTTDGVVRLAGSNTFSGDTRILAGTLQLEHPSALQGSTLDLKAGDKGTIQFALPGRPEVFLGGVKGERDLPLRGPLELTVGLNGSSTEYAGQISGPAITLYKTGSGTWTLTGNNNYQGTTIVAQGTLEIGAGGTSGSVSTPITVDAGAMLLFHRGDDVRFDLPIEGAGGLIKRGQGTLALAAPEYRYQGPTHVAEGTLWMEGNHWGGGPYQVGGVGRTATLGGTGIVEANVRVEAGSSIAPGLSLGTLTIQGDVELMGTLDIQVDGSGVGFADLLAVLGTLTLGPTATLRIEEWTPIDDEFYVIASYQSLWGTFVDVTGLPPGYMVDYNFHGANQIALVIPEPATAALLSLGGGLGIIWRRRQNPSLAPET